jgi:hypothetical protein
VDELFARAGCVSGKESPFREIYKSLDQLKTGMFPQQRIFLVF